MQRDFRILSITTIAISIAVAFTAMLEPIVASTFEMSRNGNEGWNAYHATRAYSDAPLYPALDSYISNNYPPLSFFIVGGFAQLTGDAIYAGRIISLFGLLVTTANVYLIVSYLTHSNIAAAIGASAFLGIIASAFGIFVAMNDPQWLAHAVMTLGFVVFLYGRHRHSLVVLSALLMVMAGLIKHNLIPLPLAVTIWCWIYSKRTFRIWFASAAAFSIAGVAWVFFEFGGDAIHGIALAPRVYALGRAVFHSATNLLWLLPWLAVFILYSKKYKLGAPVRLILLYAALSIVWATIISGGQGVWVNAFFDAYIAFSILAAVAVAALINPDDPAKGCSRRVRLLAIVLLLGPSIILSFKNFRPVSLVTLSTHENVVREQISIIRRHPGPAICNFLAYCYWAGKSLHVDLFNLGQKFRTGALRETEFIDKLERRQFAIIQVRPGMTKTTPKVLDAMYRNYRRTGPATARSILLVPK